MEKLCKDCIYCIQSSRKPKNSKEAFEFAKCSFETDCMGEAADYCSTARNYFGHCGNKGVNHRTEESIAEPINDLIRKPKNKRRWWQFFKRM